MSRRKSSFTGQWSGRLIEMLESPAFRALSLAAHRIIHRVEIELAHHGGKDNGRLPVTFDDFERYGIHRHSIAPGIREAVALGFLEITQKGRAGNAEWRQPNLFRLTFRPAKGVYGSDGSHEWRKIREEEALAIATDARKAKSEKTKLQWRKMPSLTPTKRTEKSRIHSAETTTTAHSAETATTLDISGREDAA
jgi:hypothetical protein